MAKADKAIESLQSRTGLSSIKGSDITDIAASNAKLKTRNLKKAASVSRLAVYQKVQFTFVDGARAGTTVFVKMNSFNVKRLGLTKSSGTVVTREVGANKRKIVVKEELVMTKTVQFSIGRAPKKRSSPTKGGRAIRGGGKTVGGGISAYAKNWVSAQVPKSATTIDIIAHAEAMKTPVYEIKFNGSTVSLKPYPSGLANGKAKAK